MHLWFACHSDFFKDIFQAGLPLGVFLGVANHPGRNDCLTNKRLNPHYVVIIVVRVFAYFCSFVLMCTLCVHTYMHFLVSIVLLNFICPFSWQSFFAKAIKKIYVFWPCHRHSLPWLQTPIFVNMCGLISKITILFSTVSLRGSFLICILTDFDTWACTSWITGDTSLSSEFHRIHEEVLFCSGVINFLLGGLYVFVCVDNADMFLEWWLCLILCWHFNRRVTVQHVMQWCPLNLS